MKAKIIIGTLVVVVAGLLLLGRSANPGSSTLSNGHPRTEPLSNTNGTAVKNRVVVAPDFSLQRLNGNTISLSEYKGVKPVVLDFWASWCPNCRRDMPQLNRFYEKHKDNVEVIAINLQENPKTVKKFAESQGFNFPIALDPNGNVSRAYGVRYTNFHVLVDIDSNIAGTVPGDIRESDILALINASKPNQSNQNETEL